MGVARLRFLLAVLAAISLPLPATAQDQAPTAAIAIELNKLEPADSACRIYFVLRNDTGDAYDALTVELVSFDQEGLVGQRLAVDLAPLRAHKTVVKLFDLPDNDPMFATDIEPLPPSVVADLLVEQLDTHTFEVFVPEWFRDVFTVKAGDVEGFIAGASAYQKQQEAAAATVTDGNDPA